MIERSINYRNPHREPRFHPRTNPRRRRPALPRAGVPRDGDLDGAPRGGGQQREPLPLLPEQGGSPRRRPRAVRDAPATGGARARGGARGGPDRARLRAPRALSRRARTHGLQHGLPDREPRARALRQPPEGPRVDRTELRELARRRRGVDRGRRRSPAAGRGAQDARRIRPHRDGRRDHARARRALDEALRRVDRATEEALRPAPRPLASSPPPSRRSGRRGPTPPRW